MPGVLKGLQPERTFYYFEEISKIPHGSYHTEKISDYLASFAKKNKLRYFQDKAHNVIIYKDAASGHEKAKTLILQGHIDMVLEKRSDIDMDLEKVPIKLKKNDDYIYAEGTTLGGDDGIAVAMMLAVLEDKELIAPALECVFTADEEVGMLGAGALDLSQLEGRRMINIDSEEEGIFTCGCAGGADFVLTLPVKAKELVPGTLFHIEVKNLLGGHSGMCINLGRANANIILGRILNDLYKEKAFRLVKAAGGFKRNAIPREASADILFKDEVNFEALKAVFDLSAQSIKAEYCAADPSIELTLSGPVRMDPSDDLPWEEIMDPAKTSYRKKDTKKIIRLLMTIPDGLLEEDPYERSLPRTSLNLGVFEAGKDKVSLVTLVRSNVNSRKAFVLKKLECLADLFEAEYEIQGEYPAWEYIPESPLRNILCEVYREVTGREAQVNTTHAGLECGLLAYGLEGLDCISLGPDMKDIHTPEEKLYIDSVQRTWDFLKASLEKLAWLD